MDAAQNFNPIGLFPLGGDLRLSGSAAVQIPLDILDRNGDSWRAAVDHHANSTAMGFAECRYSK
jgi:hypothetical protein